MERQTGITTKQMKEAPHGSLYIWCTSDLTYPKRLARDIGRTDLEIVRPSWLSGYQWMGKRFPGIVLDHAAHLQAHQWETYDYLAARLTSLPPDGCAGGIVGNGATCGAAAGKP